MEAPGCRLPCRDGLFWKGGSRADPPAALRTWPNHAVLGLLGLRGGDPRLLGLPLGVSRALGRREPVGQPFPPAPAGKGHHFQKPC